MSAANNGGPAFPTSEEHGFNSGAPGMTLHDYFAAHATEEDIACAVYDLSASGGLDGCTSSFQRRARARLAFADAMIAERSA